MTSNETAISIGEIRSALGSWIADVKAGRDAPVSRLMQVFDDLADLKSEILMTGYRWPT